MKKHNKIVMLAKSKLNSIEIIISLATIINEKEKYEGMKGIRMIKSINELNKEKGKTTDM